MARALTFTSPLGPDKFVLQSMEAYEELGRLFEYKLRLLSKDGAIKLDDLIGKNVTISVELVDGRTRYFNGEVAEFEQITESFQDYFVYVAIVRPELWYLSLTADCKIFQQKTAVDIIKAVLGDGAVTYRTSLSKTYRTLEYCVQYNESDFNFVSRLMEQEGIYYFFEHAQGTHKMVLADSISAHKAIEGEASIAYMSRRDGFDDDTDHVFDWKVRHKVRTGVWAHTDFDFVKPKSNLEAKSQIVRLHPQSSNEVFTYPGSYTVVVDGTGYARNRIEEEHTVHDVVVGRTNALQMAVGGLFTLTDYPRADQNVEHLITMINMVFKQEIETAGGAVQGTVDTKLGVFIEHQFGALEKSKPFRAAWTTPRPIVRGPQTAIVVGKAGEEIWTDLYARVKVQFHWDRYGQKNENSSCWLRVGQVWAGPEWGAIHIPRIGQEVIVDFLEGDPDCPIVTGRVYNGDNMPPYALPANQTQSGIKSRSSKSGTAQNFNELRFEDKKDSEHIYFHAEKDFTRIVENNDVLKVGFDKKQAGDQTIDIYNNRTTTIEQGNEKLQVKVGNRETLVDTGNDTHVVKTGNRETTVTTGNDTHTISTGNREVTVSKGNDTLTVTTGNMTVTVTAGTCKITAGTAIELICGGSSIKMTPSSIAIESPTINIKASGTLNAESPATTVKGTGMLTLQGGVVKIN